MHLTRVKLWKQSECPYVGRLEEECWAQAKATVPTSVVSNRHVGSSEEVLDRTSGRCCVTQHQLGQGSAALGSTLLWLVASQGRDAKFISIPSFSV